MKYTLETRDSGVTRWEYKPVEEPDVDYDSTSDIDESTPPTTHGFRNRKRWIAFAAVLVFATISSTSYILHQRSYKKPIATHKSVCNKPSKRLEWRQLDSSEQNAYISAVKCLMQRPSYFEENTSFYDDFILAHSKVGYIAHYAAAFLPWHRMYMHVYEKALRGHCGYEGTFPYWDWTLDSKDLFASPIWDPVHGFGGNGNQSTPDVVVEGLCVTDGPFANMRRAWKGQRHNHDHEVTLYPHCMARDFAFRTRSASDVEWLHALIHPDYVNATLQRPNYELFFTSFEAGAHNSIPQLLQGDWLTFTAPNDPVFFLHHTQVDRLWWLWQMQDPKTRLKQFHGPAEDFRNVTIKHSTASKNDVLPMGGLADDMKVEDVMDTQGEYLCYEY